MPNELNIGASSLEYLASKFLVRIPGVGFIGQFKDCSAIEAEVQVIKKRVGGSNLAKKVPGNIDVMPVTLSHGTVHGDRALFDHFKETCNMLDERAMLASNLIYKNIDIIQTDRNANPLFRWKLYKCWASKFASGQWDADQDEVRVEQITFEIESFDESPDLSGIDLVALLGS